MTRLHEIKLHANTSATAELAPFLGTYLTKGTKEFNTFVELVANKSGMKVLEVEGIINQVVAEAVKLEVEAPVRINLGFGTLYCRITGGFDASDSQFDPEKNKYEIALSLDDSVKNGLVDIQPSIVTEDTSVKVRVDNVMDKTTPRPYQVLRTNATARMTGMNLILTDAGAKLVFISNTGAELVVPSTAITAIDKQVVEFVVPSNMAAGDYKCAIYSRGGEAEGPLQFSFRRVKVLEVADPTPTITGLQAEGLEPDQTKYECVGVLSGTNLKMEDGDKLYMTLLTEDGETDEEEMTGLTSTPTTITSGSTGFWPQESQHPDGEWCDPESTVTLKLVKSDGTTVSHRIYCVQ